MLKRIFSQKLHTESRTVNNAIITLGDIDDSGKGKKFKSRFIQPGLAGYPGQYGNVLITKETLDDSINTIIGAPVIINHKDITANNADDERVGVIANVWYNEKDGWYWCDGVIWDETAQNLITDKKWSVSCSYDYLAEDDTGGMENNIPYDREFTKLNFVHLALVDNPRYERANIVFNSKTFKEEDHPRDDDGKFTDSSNDVNPNYKDELKQVIDKAKNNPSEHHKLVIGKVSKDLEEKARENGFDISDFQHDLDVSGTRHAIKEHGQPKTEEPRGQIAITDEDFEKIPDVIYGYDEVAFTGKNKIGRETITYKKAFDDGTIMYVEEIRNKRKTLTINTMHKHKNTGNPRTFVDNNNPLSNASINILTDISQNFNPQRINIKEHEDMALINELKKLISKVENDKGEEMHKDIKNDKEDKRKLIDEIGGILKGKVDEELWRTIIGKAEKLAYEKSEKGTSDNEKKDDDDKKTDNRKTTNDKVDKRELIRKIMAIAGEAGVSDEDVRTISKFAEELAYDKSERGTADNESEEDKEKVKELEDDMRKDADNKKSCRNSVHNSRPDYFEHMNKVYNTLLEPPEECLYVSRADKLKAAEEYFS